MQARERDMGLRRLRRTTVVAGVGVGVLAAAFGGLAARALPGKQTVAPARTPPRARATATVTPPPLVPVPGAGSSSAPAPPPSPPAATSAPPVVVSGGT